MGRRKVTTNAKLVVRTHCLGFSPVGQVKWGHEKALGGVIYWNASDRPWGESNSTQLTDGLQGFSVPDSNGIAGIKVDSPPI